MAKTLVSILIPCFNARSFLSQTLRSALNQSWENKEIIVADDGSTDGSLEVAKRFECNCVRVISTGHLGACRARNIAFEASRGEYIQWLDADDVLHPDKIRLQIEAIRKSNLGDSVLLTGPFGTFFYRTRNARFSPSALWQDLLPADWILEKFRTYTWMNPAAWLLSRTLAESAGPWDETLSRDQDGEYICRVVSRAHFVKFVPDAISLYRVANNASISKTHSRKACESIWRSTKLCIGYLLDLEDSPRTRLACIQYLELCGGVGRGICSIRN